MQLIPVLEIRHGQGVHTEPKNAFTMKVVNDDPHEIIKYWIASGINRIHIVDVDAIEQGEPVNVDLIDSLKSQFPSLGLQVSGGINSVESAFIYIDAGVDHLVLSSRVLKRESLLVDICIEFENKVIMEVDTRNGMLGITSGSANEQTLQQFSDELSGYGVDQLVVTDIPKSGHVNYKNIQTVDIISSSSSLPIYVNGGINSIDDLDFLLENKPNNLSGILLGKVIYNKKFNLASAVELLSRQQLAS
ncbi:MAG: hypothetical protein COA86_14520 [Kangiella sp.]|nr:MAG: hypothetical protein COA86_14520 [Kangiella sp.]